FWMKRKSPPNLNECLPATQVKPSETDHEVSRWREGASRGAPKRAKGNKPSSVGSMMACAAGLPVASLDQKESSQPPNAPAVPGAAPLYWGSRPLSSTVCNEVFLRPSVEALKFTSCGVSVNRNWLMLRRVSFV